MRSDGLEISTQNPCAVRYYAGMYHGSDNKSKGMHMISTLKNCI
jgi:hypothetical protein